MAHYGAGIRWKPEDDAKLRELMAAGRTLREISVILGRGYNATKEHSRWLSLTPEQKEQRRARLRSDRGRVYIRRIDETSRCEIKPAHVFEDAKRRLLMPRTLTSQLMGDPAPGYSALDRKRREMRP